MLKKGREGVLLACITAIVEGLCCPALRQKKKQDNWSWNQSFTSHQASPLSQAHYLQRHTHTPIKGILYILFTHTQKHTHPRRHTSSQRNHCSIMQTQHPAKNNVDYDPSTQRHCYLTLCVLQGKTKRVANELQVTAATCALSGGGEEACLFEMADFFTTQLLVRKRKTQRKCKCHPLF